MKSKIKNIQEIKPWGEGDRKTFYHNLEMENGDKINIGKKKELTVGQELEYEIVGEGQEYNKAKAIQKPFNNGEQDSSGSYCLSYAKDFVSTMYGPSDKGVKEDVRITLKVADLFKEWLDKNS